MLELNISMWCFYIAKNKTRLMQIVSPSKQFARNVESIFLTKYEKYCYICHLLCLFVSVQRVKGMYTLSREATLVKLVYFTCEKGSILKGKNLLPLGANSFLLE